MFGFCLPPSPCVCLSFVRVDILQLHCKRVDRMIRRMRLAGEAEVVGVVCV